MYHARPFPVRIPAVWKDGAHPAIARQVVPDPGEDLPDAGDLPDPVGEARATVVPWLLRKYPDRVLLLVTRRCFVHCRYCFRRDQEGPAAPSAGELAAAIAAAKASGAREAILSGGDPLTLSDTALVAIADALRPEVEVVRIHSRAPVAAPDRVTPALARALGARRPARFVAHVNHAAELAPAPSAAVRRLQDAGVEVWSQSVLLRGVNDDPDVLLALFDALARQGVRPHYLHHPDPVPGNAAFRLTVDEGLDIWRTVEERAAGLPLPRYVIDLPDGSGKVPVAAVASPSRSLRARIGGVFVASRQVFAPGSRRCAAPPSPLNPADANPEPTSDAGSGRRPRIGSARRAS